MDYSSYLSNGPNQAYPFDDLSDQQTARMSSQSLQGNPGLYSSDFFPDHSFQFANGHHQPPFAYPPPLPHPHNTPAEPGVGAGPLSDRGNNSFDLTVSASDVGSATIGDDGSRSASGTRPDSAASTESTERDERDGADAQSRRRAQNREAQRAFRERKERRVRDLEDELTVYKEKCANLLKHNEELKRQVARFSTENVILRATAQAHFPDHENKEDEECTAEDKAQDTTGAQRNSATGRNNVNGPVWPNKFTIMDGDGDTPMVPMQQGVKVNAETGERFLDASATWDLIADYRARNNVALDVQDIYVRMKGKTICDGQGAVIRESCVIRAIKESLETKDDLL